MRLRTYVIRHILFALPLIVGVMSIVFVLVHLAPGDPIITVLGMRPGIDFTPADIERIRHAYGLDRPLHIQYLDWLQGIITGDWGYSFQRARPVSQLIISAVRNTIVLQVTSFLLSVAIAIPAGVISAVRQYSKMDYGVTLFSTFFWAMPSFWLGIMFIMIFSANLGILPSSGMAPIGSGIYLSPIHLILPVLTLGLHGTAFMARLTRGSMLEVLRQDYVMTARAKGIKERVVIYKHAFRNAMLPVITLIGVYVGWLISGSVIVETVFAWPGMGMLIVDSANFRDYPVVMGVTLVASLSVIVAVLITDIAYAYLDPRIRYE